MILLIEIGGLEAEMKTRIISGIFMIPLALFVYLGGYWLLGAVTLVGILALNEFYNAFEAHTAKIWREFGFSMALFLVIIAARWPFKLELFMLWIIISMTGFCLHLFHIKKRRIEDTLVGFFGLIYVFFFIVHVYLIDTIDEYRMLKWLIFITAFGTDIFAYFTGFFFGRHKLVPNLSPKKTIEGAIGGVVGTLILSGLFGFLIVPHLLKDCLILGFFCSILAQLGDLTASAFKRKLEVKDYGNLIPGHGGIMDRIDSILFTAPAIFYYIVLIFGEGVIIK